MNLEFLMWSNISVTRIELPHSVWTVPCGTIRVETDPLSNLTALHVQGYDGINGLSNGLHGLYANPKLLFLNSQKIEFLAEGWEGNNFYPVKITATF